MKRRYQARVEFVRVSTDADGSSTREITFGPRWLEVVAESASEARDQVAELAKRQWRPRKGAGEVMLVDDVRPVEPEPKKFFGFRYEREGDYTARWRTYYGNLDYVPGQSVRLLVQEGARRVGR